MVFASFYPGLMFQPPAVMLSESPLRLRVKFVSDLHQREVDTHPQTEAVQEWEPRAQRYADETMKKADADGIDNVRQTWSAVRLVKAARKGEIFEPREPYPFNRYWK
jgi:hypothetical protein